MPRQRSPLSSLTFPAQQQEAKDLPFASAHRANLLPTKRYYRVGSIYVRRATTDYYINHLSLVLNSLY